MSLDALGLFLFGVFAFLMGKDYNPKAPNLSLSNTGDIVFGVWALVGCFSFVFGWFSFK
ncbi:hypothetical protein [Vibrio crassostreae]|uniref:hypothetical protein n=1 Tax=Vibrio crassostreae TaxID=246167 RepID=UPI001B315D99|nr:hypothetical protein [Vibrio crassostreae]CAK1885641.1 conserved hypothetical protein [Vibrio crassostreae]